MYVITSTCPINYVSLYRRLDNTWSRRPELAHQFDAREIAHDYCDRLVRHELVPCDSHVVELTTNPTPKRSGRMRRDGRA